MMTSRSFLALLAVAIFAAALPGAVSSVDQNVVIRGHLDPQSVQSSASADAPLTFIAENGKKYEVSGDSMSNAQIRDPRLLDRTWELVGSARPDGHFEITKLFTVKDGRRYRVTYYCEICHIVTHEPGRCMCCQGDTELREVLDE